MRTALVTGGVRGIGQAICKELTGIGFRVAANYLGNHEAATQFQKETGIATYSWDVADYDACQKGITQIKEELGPIDILVNNAGITRDAFLHKMTPTMWAHVINTNLTSNFNMCHKLIEDMRQQGFGRIIIMSSSNGLSGCIGQTNYAAAKAGVIGFAKALSLENAEKGITVNCIAPGYVKTGMMQTIPDLIMEKIRASIPVKRLACPKEVAKLVAFLAQDDASFITGATFSINGGQYML